MSLRIRRGTDAQRATTPLDLGELVFTTDTKQLYVGNGIDAGGNPIIRLGTGLAWADVACTTIIATGAALQVSADAAPTLGGNLSLNNYNLIGTGNVSINGLLTTTTAGSTVSNPIVIQKSRGTVTSPLSIVLGDNLGGIEAFGYTGGSFQMSSSISAASSLLYPVTSTAVPGRVDISVANSTGFNELALTVDSDMSTTFYQKNSGQSNLYINSYISNGTTGTATNFRRHSGTISVPTAVRSGDRIHTLTFQGWDGTNAITGASIHSNMYGVISTGLIQSDLRINCRKTDGTFNATIFTATTVLFGQIPILPSFAGTAAADAVISNPLTLTGTVTVAIGGAFTLGTSFTGNLTVGKQITISGTLSGATITSYTDPTTYFITATNGSTTFTLSTTSGGAAITTTAGTLTGATLILTTLPRDGMMYYDTVTSKITARQADTWVVLA